MIINTHTLESVCTQQLELGKLKTLVHRTYETCFTDEHLRDELKHISSTFNEISYYTQWIISKVFIEIKNKMAYRGKISQYYNDEDQNQHLLVLPYKGQKGEVNEKTVKCCFTKEC